MELLVGVVRNSHVQVLGLAVLVPTQGLHHYVCHVLTVHVLLCLLLPEFVEPTGALVNGVLHLEEGSLLNADVRHPWSHVYVRWYRELVQDFFPAHSSRHSRTCRACQVRRQWSSTTPRDIPIVDVGPWEATIGEAAREYCLIIVCLLRHRVGVHHLHRGRAELLL